MGEMTMPKRLKKIGFAAGRVACLYFLFCFLSFLSWVLLQAPTFQKNTVGFWDDELYFRVGYVYSLIIFFSTSSVFQLHNTILKHSFNEARGDRSSIFQNSWLILKNAAFWMDSAVLCLLGWCCFALPPLAFLEKGFLTDVTGARKMLLSLAALLGLWAIWFLASLSTLGWWGREAKKKSSETKTLRSFLIQLLYTSLLWLLGGFLLAILWPLLSGFFKLFYQYLGLAILLIVVVIFARDIILHGSMFFHRRAFVRKLRKLCEAQGYDFSTEGRLIKLTKSEKQYVCRFVGGLQQKNPLELREDGVAEYSRFRIWWSHTILEPYAFDAAPDQEKLLLVCPSNGMVFAKDDHAHRRLESGDRMLEYKVYHASDFLNAVDRNYL